MGAPTAGLARAVGAVVIRELRVAPRLAREDLDVVLVEWRAARVLVTEGARLAAAFGAVLRLEHDVAIRGALADVAINIPVLQ